MSLPALQPTSEQLRDESSQGYVRCVEKTSRNQSYQWTYSSGANSEQKSRRSAFPLTAIGLDRNAGKTALLRGSGTAPSATRLTVLCKHCGGALCYDAGRAPWGTRSSSPPGT